MSKKRLSFSVTSSTISTIMLSLFCASAAYSAPGQIIDYRSANGINEKCIIFPEIPGGVYSSKDHEKENAFCSLDFNNNSIAMCPKTWSTSPGVMLYKVPAGSTSRDYEAQKCGLRSGHTKAGKFKITMSEANTSGTYSTSSLLYYHVSRYLDAHVKVPAAVKRTVDARSLNDRVASKARGQGGMNINGWAHLRRILTSNGNERTDADHFAGPGEVYGVILRDQGERYGTEINGVRSGWGDAQNNDFQKTAAFSALRTPAPFAQAIQSGIRSANASSKLAADLAGQPSPIQMMSWMQELTEITLLDYIFSQQDRVGNVDFEWQWVYVQAGQVKYLTVDSDLPRRSMSKITPPAEIAAYSPQLIQRTSIGDNDAGGKVAYANYTKRTKMLEGIMHYSADTYRKLMQLDQDLSSQGQIYQYIAGNFKVTPRELQMYVGNTRLAASILKATCQSGKMRFDLDPEKLMLGSVTEEVVDCNGN